MSLRRQDLVPASEKMSTDLEKIQQDSQRHNEHIEKTLEEVKQEQEAAKALLQSDCLTKDRREVAFSKQIEAWTVSDVIHWLQNKNLHKFIILFQKHRVTGKELLDLRLPFLDNYDHISREERETLLSEIYTLLYPTPVHASEEDLTKIKSPLDRQKYMAAVELAQSRSSPMYKSSSVLVLSTQYSSSKSSSSQSSPLLRPRHKSESGTAGRLQMSKVESCLSEHGKRRRTLPKMTKKAQVSSSLYDSVKIYGPQCIRCVDIPKQQDGSLGVSMTTGSEGHVIIDKVSENLKSQLCLGDRVLEINGRQLTSSVRDITPLLKSKTAYVQLVVVSQQSPNESTVRLDNGYSQENWIKLRSILVDMRDNDPHLGTQDLSTDQRQYLKNTALLQEQVKKLQEKIDKKEAECNKLEALLEEKAAIMHDLEVSRDKAIEKLKQTRSRVKHKNRRESLGGEEYYNVTMDSLKPDTCTKEEVIESLRDIVREASKQKWYLDRLISLVIEESPWLLDEVDTEFDQLTLTDQSEEFC